MTTISKENSISPLTVATFTGTTVNVSTYSAVSVTCKANVGGTITIRQSFDGINWDKADDLTIVADIFSERTENVVMPYLSVYWSATSTTPSSGRITTKLHSNGLGLLSKKSGTLSTADDSGMPIFAVRDNVLSTLAIDDGDYTQVRVNSTGALYTTLNSETITTSGTITSVVSGTGTTNLGKAVGNVAGATDVGVASLAVRDDSLSTLVVDDGDYTHLRVNSTGALYTTLNSETVTISGAITSVIPGTGATNLGKAVGNATGTTDVGTASLAMRDDAVETGSTLSDSNGDYTFIRVNRNGALFTIPLALGSQANAWSAYNNEGGTLDPIYSTVLDCQNLKCVSGFGRVTRSDATLTNCTLTLEMSMNNSTYYDTGIEVSITGVNSSNPVDFNLTTNTFGARYCRINLVGLITITATITAKS